MPMSKRKKWCKQREKQCKPRIAGTRYNGYPEFVISKIDPDLVPQVVKPTRAERIILARFYAEEFRPMSDEELDEELEATKTYLTKDKQIKSGPKWKVARPQLERPVTSWRRAQSTKHHLEPIEPTIQLPPANWKANQMDLESMAQMSSRYEAIAERQGND